MNDQTGGVAAPTPQLSKFYLTFGVQYSHTPHPTWPGAHPDGWVLIEASTEARARGLAYLYFKEYWSMLTPEAHFPAELNKRQYYPLGEIAALAVGHATVPLHHQLGRGIPEPVPAVPTTASDPLWYGVFPNERAAVRIEGTLKHGGDRDAIEQLGYEVEYFHRECMAGGMELFDEITATDTDVKAFELDWSQPYECPVCEVSIT